MVRSKIGGYICLNCRASFDLDLKRDRVICPSCSYRTILKKRPQISKKVLAR